MGIKGELTFPGDKSISHRALMFAGLAEGESRISNLSTGVDVQSTRKCLEACGIKISNDRNDVIVKGRIFSDPTEPLDCGNSGTTTRLLLGLLAGQGINATFVGDSSLSARPMNRILEPLSQMGLKCESHDGKLPITIHKSDLNGIQYESPVASAQIKSAILLAGLGASGKTSVEEPILSRDHTEKMIHGLGVDISIKGLTATVSNLSSPFSSFQFSIPGDPSTAAFFAASAALVPNSEIVLNRVLANPTRIGFFTALEKMGAGMECLDQWDEAGEQIGNLKIFHQALNGTPITKDNIPGLIDEIPIIAILASQADSPTTVSGAEELRVKESDRINAICLNLSKMGCELIEKQDGFIIIPGNRLSNTNVETFSDHRIAMAFTIAGLLTHDKNILDNESCINISFPEFNTILDEIQR